MARIGLDKLYYALMTSDTVGGAATYNAPIALPGASQANKTTNSSASILWLDDGPSSVATALGNGEIELLVGELPLSVVALLLGHTVTGGVLRKLGNATPINVAIGYRSLKDDGTYRYTWLTKVMFREPDATSATKPDTIEYQLDTIIGSILRRSSDNEWELIADEGQEDIPAATLTNWFTNTDVLIGSTDVTAPQMSSSIPIDDSGSAALDTTVAITFDEIIYAPTVIASNFIFVKTTDGTPVAFTVSLDATGLIATLVPDADLTSATEYSVFMTTNIKDLAGNSLAGDREISFTTTA